MSGEDGNEEFYRQLQLQQQYEAEPGGEGESDPFTYVDPADGAAYEWDREKKAWFPKVGAGRASALPDGGRAAGPARCPLSRCEERPPRLAAALRGGASGGGSFPPWRAEVSPRKGENEEQLVLGLFATEVSGLSGFGQIDVCCEVSVVLKRSFLQAKPRQLALSPSVTLPAAFRSFVAKSCRLAFLLGCESLELLGPGMKSRLYLWILTNRCCL